MAKKTTNDNDIKNKVQINGNKKDGVGHARHSPNRSDNDHLRDDSGGSRDQSKGSDLDKPMIHVEPDNPWPRR